MKTQKFPAYRIISTSQFIHVLQSGIQNHERFCFILGSGASVDSGIPMGGTLEKYWMDCLMGKSIDKDGTLPFDRKETIQLAHDLKSASPSKLEYDFKEIVAAWDTAESNKENTLPSKYYFDIYKVRFFPNHRNGYHYLENIMDKADPSIGYRILAQLLTDEKARNNLVITTNFDSLVEDSLFLYTRERPLVINHELLADYLGTPNIERPIIAKVHRGLFFDPLNAPEDVDQLKGKWKEVLKQVLNFYTPIVIGYGGGDHSLMNLLSDKSTKMPNGIYWCYMAEHGLPERKIQNLVEENNGCFVRTLGFDPLMFKIGDTLCPQIIGVNDTANYLKIQSDVRAESYQEKISEIQKQVEHFADISSGEVSEYQETVKRFSQREDDARKSRKAANSQTALDYLQQGIEFLDHKDFDNAIQVFTTAIELNSAFAHSYNGRGVAYLSTDKYMKALADFTRAIELNPKNDVAYNNLGAVYKKLEKYEESIAAYTKAIELNPLRDQIYNNRGNTYSLMKNFEEAIKDYTKAIELNPEHADAYNNRGSAYDSLENYAEAIKDYTKAIELNPKNDAAYNNRGYAYDSLENYAEAIKNYTKAIELNPKNDAAYNNRGSAYNSLENYSEAIKDFTKAIELNPKNDAAYNNRGSAYDSLENYAEAIQDYTKAIELNPKNDAAYNNRGYAYDSLENYAEAIKDYTKAIELNPEFADAYNNRGATYKMIGELGKAIYDLQTAKKINKIDPLPHRHLGDVYALQEKYDKAIEEYSTAIHLNDTYKEAYEGRARAYRKIGKIQEAEQDEETAKNL